MAKRSANERLAGKSAQHTPPHPRPSAGRASSLIDTRVIYCGDGGANGLEQLAKLPDACIELVCIDPPFTAERTVASG